MFFLSLLSCLVADSTSTVNYAHITSTVNYGTVNWSSTTTNYYY